MQIGDICVVVRSCGRPQLLARALDSIRAQTLQPKEIIVVAIGPAGAEALNAVSQKAALNVIPTSPGRVRGAALNDGIRVMKGTWCAFLDDDDTWASTFLEELRAAAAVDGEAPDFGASVCRTELVYERLREEEAIEVGRKPFNPNLVRVSTEEMANANQFTINAALWHRRVFATVGEFREDLSFLEDWEFNLRATLQFRIDVLPRMLARYHQRPSSDPQPNTQRRQHDRAARELQEGWRRNGLNIRRQPFARWRKLGWRLGSWLRWRLR